MDEQPQHYDKKYASQAMIMFAVFIIFVMYIETMLVPSLPAIAQEYHVDAAEVSLVLSLYLVGGIALSPVVGKLGDIYGKKRVLGYVLPIYVVAVGITGFSPNFDFLLVARTIQGIGLTIFPLMVSLMQEEFPRDMVPRAIAIITAMFGVGTAIGLPVGSLVASYLGWQGTYHTMLPLVLAISVLILLKVRESRYTRPDAKIDFVGAIGLSISLALIVFGLSFGTSFGWTSLPVLSMLVIGLLILVVIIPYERRVSEAVLNFRLLGIRNVAVSGFITFISGLSFFFAYQTFVYLFESAEPLGFGLTILQAGMAMAPFAIMNVIAAPIAGKYIPKLGAKPFIYAGAVIAIAGMLISSSAGTVPFAILGDTVIGLGVALVGIPTLNLLVLSIDRRDMGLANSTNAVFRFLGSAVGAPIAGLLIAQYASRLAFQYAFYLAIVTMIAVIVINFFAEEILGKNRVITKLEKEVSI